MADEKKKFVPSVKHLTPVGVARFPKLNEPDEYQGTVKFKTGLIMSAKDAETVIKVINAEMPKAVALMEEWLPGATAKAKAKNKAVPDQEEMTPYQNVMDPDSGEPTGDILFSFASGADQKVFVGGKDTGKTKRRVLPFFDAAGQPVPTSARPNLWGGSRLRISYSCYPYHNAGANNYGVSLRIEAVKVIQAVSGGGSEDASAYGMGEAEEGWSRPTADESMGGDESEGEGPSADGPGASDF